MEAREKMSVSRTAAVVSLIEKGLDNNQGQTECQACGSTEGVRLVQLATRDLYLCRECREDD
jgi:ribosomal protein S14